jgi:hypothetical protein
MPMHGEYYMLKTHAQTAIDCGIDPKNVFILDNGRVLTFNQDGAKVLSTKVPAGEILIDGMDIGGNPLGTNVYAAAAGKVNRIVVRASCGGNIVYIQHTINGKKLRSLYMHLHSVKVKVGDIVTANTVVGTVGGNESYEHCSTGAHLHFGIMKGWEGTTYYNPRNYVSFPKLGNRFTSRW